LATLERVPSTSPTRTRFDLRRTVFSALLGLACHACQAETGGLDLIDVQSSTRALVLAAHAQTLSAPDDSTNIDWGRGIALGPETLLVRGLLFGDPPTLVVHLFERSNGAFQLVDDILLPDSAYTQYFGRSRRSLVLDGDTAYIGDPNTPNAPNMNGRVHVLRRDATGLAVVDVWDDDGIGVTGYGAQIALSGDVLVIGAPLESDPIHESGVVYVYRRQEGTFVLHEKLTSPLPSEWGYFGGTLDLQGERLVIASGLSPTDPLLHFFDVGQTEVSFVETLPLETPDVDGSYFVPVEVWLDGGHLLVAINSAGPGDIPSWVAAFRRENGTWMAVQTLSAEVENTPGGNIIDVALSGNTAAIGWSATLGTRVDLFEWTGAIWEPSSTVDGWTSETRPRTALALREDVLIVADEPTSNVHVYALDQTLGAACGGDDDCTSGFCRDGVCCENECGDGVVDDCLACSVAMGAPRDGLCAPASGNTCADGDDDLCTAGMCAAGLCTRGPLSCDDENPCTFDTCESDGCAHTSVDDGTPCVAGTCTDGKCAPVDAPLDGGARVDGGDATTPPGCTCEASSSSETAAHAALVLCLMGASVMRKRVKRGSLNRTRGTL
jgi:hypothetical protein